MKLVTICHTFHKDIKSGNFPWLDTFYRGSHKIVLHNYLCCKKRINLQFLQEVM